MPLPAIDQIQLLTADAITQTPYGQYLGDFVVHLPALPSEGDGFVNEIDFAVPHPDLPGVVIGFHLYPSTGDPADFATDLVVDSTALPAAVAAWDTFVASVYDWGKPTGITILDGTLTTYDTGLTITVDSANSNAAYAGWAGPHITSFTPTVGGPGTTIVFTGAGFTAATAIAVAAGGPVCTFTVDSDTQITAVVQAPKTAGVQEVNFTVGGVTYWGFQNFTIVNDGIMATGSGNGSLPVTCSIGNATDAIQIAFLSVIGGTLDLDVSHVQDTSSPRMKQPTGDWQVISYRSTPHASYVLARTPGAVDTVSLPLLAAGRWYAFGNIQTIDSVPSPWLFGMVVSLSGTAFSTVDVVQELDKLTSRPYLVSYGARFAINSPTAVPSFPTPTDIDVPVGSFASLASQSAYFANLDATATGSARAQAWVGDSNSPYRSTATLSTSGDGYGAAVFIGSRPANDDFANAELIGGSGGAIVGSNAFATYEANDPPFLGGDTITSGNSMIWYRWVAPASGSVTFTTDGSVYENSGTSMSTELRVSTGTTLLDLVDVGADAAAHPPSTVTFDAVAGTTYWIRFNGDSFFDRGDVLLGWDVVALPNQNVAKVSGTRLHRVGGGVQ